MAASNLKKRTLTGLILMVTLVVFIWLDRIILPIFMLTFVTFASNEYFRFWHRKDVYPHTLAVLFPIYAITLLIYYETPLLLPMFILFIFVCLLSIMRYPGSRRTHNFLTEIAAGFLGSVYLSILPVTIVLLRKISFTICLMPFILTWLYDTFAYFAGSALGQHGLAPKLSPKKTWEGTILALPLTLPFTLLLSRLWYPDFSVIDGIWITAGIGVLGTLGDLFESGMKREVGLKDSSGVFPGHGGFLDRIDSLIFSVPFFYMYLITMR
ncbi:phosphatidate cytidylyltransferase [candidate division WOR-3 bacterium]|nr:phosphatidate cytidylyltransferase [candidate division WOR-3 bacterium]